MAKGDTVELKDGDEIELSFQLAMKLAEIKKRRDAAKLSHISIEFTIDTIPDPALGGSVGSTALDADVTGDPERFQILPITQDDQKFARLYRIGPIKMFVDGLKPQPMFVSARVRLCDAAGKSEAVGQLPKDGVLLRLHVKP